MCKEILLVTLEWAKYIIDIIVICIFFNKYVVDAVGLQDGWSPLSGILSDLYLNIEND